MMVRDGFLESCIRCYEQLADCGATVFTASRTTSCDRKKALQKAARAPAARREAQRRQGEVGAALAEAEARKIQVAARTRTVWERELVKQSRKGSKTYTYEIASWREGDRTRAPAKECQECSKRIHIS